MNKTTETLPDDVATLQEMVRSLGAEKDSKEQFIGNLQQEIKLLREQIRLLKSQRFGRKSEKFIDHPSLFNEAEIEVDAAEDDEQEDDQDEVDVKPHKRRKRGRKSLSKDLPRVDVIHDLPDSEKICPIDGHQLEVFGEEVTEQLGYEPPKVFVIRHVQLKYRCPHCHKGVKTASKPPQPIPGGIASAALLAFIVVSKYLDGLPLYRIARIFSRIGADLNRTTLANWMN